MFFLHFRDFSHSCEIKLLYNKMVWFLFEHKFLRVTFKWFIKGERWIIVCGSYWIYKELFKYLAITAYF